MDATTGTGSRFTLGETLRYAAVGALNAAIGYGLFCALWLTLHRWLHYLIVLTISNLLIMALGYWLNRVIVFRSTDRWVGQSARYYLVYGVCVVANYLVMLLMVEVAHTRPILAQLVATVVSSALGFVANKLFTFSPTGPR